MRRDTTAAWLLEHRPADATEAAHVRTVLGALAAEPDPFARTSAAPGHVTASAFVLSPDGRSLLLIHHGKLHRWLQPGGHVDPDDVDVVAAARREVGEETGLDALERLGGHPRFLDVDVHAIPANPRRGEPEHLHLDLRVAFRAVDARARAGSDALDVRWVPVDEVGALEGDASVARALARLSAIGPVPPDGGAPGSLDPEAAAVLAFWFGDEAVPTAAREASWWSHDAALDRAVAERFGALHARAATGGLDAWAASGPRSRLALILVLDQLSRHLHRDTAGMFAQDAAAARHVVAAVAGGEHLALGPYERLFLFLPLMHAEDRDVQAASVACFRQLADDAAAAGLHGFAGNVDFALRHRAIVERFGRFPHRNAALGRASTAEEVAFLREPGSSF